MKALRTFFIAMAIAWILSFQVAPAFWHGVAISDIFSLVSGNTAFYVNPSSSGTTPCGVSGGSTCAAGNDGNACLTISAPCLTFQHAAYLLTQTLVWGVKVGTATIYLGNGTMNEVVQVGSPIGLPTTCANCGGQPIINIVGNDGSESSVILSAPNASCPVGPNTLAAGVLAFVSPGAYNIHGFTVTAVNEVTNQCADVSIVKGAAVYANNGTMDYGPPAKGSTSSAAVITNSGDYFNGTMVIAVGGAGRADSILQTGTGGNFWLDGSAMQFSGTNTLSGGSFGVKPAMFQISTPGGWITTPSNISFSGAISGRCAYINGARSYWEGNDGLARASFAGCTPLAALGGSVGDGATIGNTVVATRFSTNLGAGGFPSSAPPTLTGCGTSPTFVTFPTDGSGTFTLGSTTSACTLVFNEVQEVAPDCVITPFSGATFTYGGINGTAGSYTGFTITATTGTFSYWCGFHD
jgi:hypothetical protein